MDKKNLFDDAYYSVNDRVKYYPYYLCNNMKGHHRVVSKHPMTRREAERWWAAKSLLRIHTYGVMTKTEAWYEWLTSNKLFTWSE